MAWEVLLYPLTASLAFVSGLAIIYYTYPVLLVQAGLRYFIYMSGMQVKFVGDESFMFCYGERGSRQKNKSTVLLIHGYTASKDQWLTVFKKFRQDVHLIAIDLPGHGNSGTPRDDEEVSFPSIIRLIHKFVCLAGLDEEPFHIVGTSLGGVIAGLYAAEHPSCVEKVTMICPAKENAYKSPKEDVYSIDLKPLQATEPGHGDIYHEIYDELQQTVKTPVDSEFSRQVEKAISLGADNIDESHCSLLPQTPEETQKMLDSCRYHKQPINTQFLKGIVALRAPKTRFFLRLFRTLASQENTTVLVDNVPKITSPTQLIWGEHDELIDKSGAEVLKKILGPKCERVDIIERCGHSVCMDRPGALVKLILTFRGEYDRKNI